MSLMLSVLGVVLVIVLGCGTVALPVIVWMSNSELDDDERRHQKEPGYWKKPAKFRWFMRRHRWLLTFQFFIVIPVIVAFSAATGIFGSENPAEHCGVGTQLNVVHDSDGNTWWTCEALR